MTRKERILAVLGGEVPDRVVFAPNIWQWFEFHKLHGSLPGELSGCDTQLDVLRKLDVDILSRNLLTDNRRAWIGGHSHEEYSAVEVEEHAEGSRRRITYHTPKGDLSEEFHFDEEGCTLVQSEHLFKDFGSEYEAWKAWLQDRELVFEPESFHGLESRVGDDGLVMVGETFCPLKMLHVAARADNAVYLLFDHESEMRELMEIYGAKALDLMRSALDAGARVIMSMDNLDSMFYPPDVFERFCRDFYTRAAELCHESDAWFFVHACGRQREILPQVVECGIDGLEGIAFPPLGDIELWEARQAGPRFIVEGGLSAAQLEGDVTSSQAEEYVRGLFGKMKPGERFVFSMSCNTSIATKWDTLKHYRDAWLEYREM